MNENKNLENESGSEPFKISAPLRSVSIAILIVDIFSAIIFSASFPIYNIFLVLFVFLGISLPIVIMTLNNKLNFIVFLLAFVRIGLYILLLFKYQTYSYLSLSIGVFFIFLFNKNIIAYETYKKAEQEKKQLEEIVNPGSLHFSKNPALKVHQAFLK